MRPDYIIHTPAEIVRIRRAAKMAAEARERICSLVRSGMTTWDLDELAGEVIRSMGGVPTFLNYRGYPGNICISLNDEVVHGIRSKDRFILNGDVVSVDVGVTFEGGVGDTAKTVYVGGPMPPDIERLLKFTESSLECGLAAARPGGFVQDISRGVEMEAKRGHLGIVEEYVGHGCGIHLHEPPEVPNFTGWGSGPVLVPGMVLCIEPMLNLGTERVVVDRHDGWTVRTRDGSWSAHFEHMVLITDSEPEILTWQKTT